MGPIEILFLIVIAIFGVIGVVRGYTRELGVTIVLLLALWVVVFVDERFSGQLARVLKVLVGADPADQEVVKALIYCSFLIGVAFISYQGETLSFPGKGQNWLLGLGAGLLNGYLVGGSLWHYLARAGWPFIKVVPEFSQLYELIVELLPPKILTWQYLVALAVLMVILRVLK